MPDKQFRSLDDLENEKEEMIHEINESKDIVEKEISRIISKLDCTVEEINREISENTNNFNSYRQELEDLYASKSKHISNELQKIVNKFKEKENNIIVDFKNNNIIVILVLGIPLIILAITYIFTYDDSTNTALSSTLLYKFLFLFPLLVLIAVLILTYNLFSKIVNKKQTNELNVENDNTDEKVPTLKITEIPQINESERTLFEESKGVLGSIICSVGKSVPFIDRFYDEVTLLVKYRQLVNNFKLSLEFYNLIDYNIDENKKFFEKIGKYVPADIYIQKDESLWEGIIAQKICPQLNILKIKQKFVFSENLLLLLYYEYNGELTTSSFNKIVLSEKEIYVLSSILIHSQKLTKSSSYEYKNEDIAAYKYKNEDIVAIIKQVKPFSLSNINDVLSDCFLILNYLNSYIEFLMDNDIEISCEPTIAYIISKPKEVSFEKRVVDLAYNLGLDNFDKISGLDRNFVDGFARASVALKFHNDLSLREVVCKYSATDYSTAILYSYFEKIKENDGQKIVSIKELISNRENVNLFLNKLEDPDIKFFQTQLKEGQWHDSSFTLLRKFFEKSKEEILEKLSDIDELDILKESVKSIYKEVNFRTIEKSIDAQLFGVYVIMFHSSSNQNSSISHEETLKNIIDNLSLRDLDQSDREKKWEFKKDSQIEEIKQKYVICPKYDFINFSANTRIGILDNNQSFQDFKEEFLKDVKNILNSKNEKFDIGIVVLKIMPSRYSFGMLDIDGLSDNIEIKDLDAVKYIARLASSKIPLEDQVSGMKLGSIDLLKIINEKSVYEIIRVINYSIKDKTEIYVLSDPELKNCLLHELNEKLSIDDFKSLALDLKEETYEKEVIDQINKVVESVLRNRYLTEESLKKKAISRPKVLSKRFTNSLKNLAIIYELQRDD